ncbi:MAG: four helix bundle protein [Bacteroidota bacterium]
MFRSFKDMPVWQEAMAIAETVFKLTNNLPKREDYGLTSQLRRAALSISANLAEGFGRAHPLEKARFYTVSIGSATETQNHLEYGLRVGYFPADDVEALTGRLENLVHDTNKLVVTLKDRAKRSKT